MALETIVLGPHELDKAAQLLRAGEVVAFPTETVYGLGANALDPRAVAAIFTAKGRPQDNPLIVHCYSQEQLAGVVREIPPKARDLMNRFWPGPLTLVLPKGEQIPPIVSAGLDTVAVRIPDHPVALALLKKTGIPVAAPSANVSGRPSPTRADHVLFDLGGRIKAIVDGGETGWGVESTVLDCTTEPSRILRPGGITLEKLLEVTNVEVDPGVYGKAQARPRSPGMKYRHYAPEADVYLIVGEKTPEKIRELGEHYRKLGKRVGIMAVTEHVSFYNGFTVLDMGSKETLQEISSRLYHLLREVDRTGIEVLLVEGVSEEHLGMAIMNRLRKAASNQVIQT